MRKRGCSTRRIANTLASPIPIRLSGGSPPPMMNPTISGALIEREIEADPEAARTEWLAAFAPISRGLFTGGDCRVRYLRAKRIVAVETDRLSGIH